MNFKVKLLHVLWVPYVVNGIILTTPAFAQKTGKEIKRVASGVTVQIFGLNPGSGVIIAKRGKTYYVLTAAHVVKTSDEYEIITPDHKEHRLDYKTVRKIQGIDLAVVQFDSHETYQVAQIGDSKELEQTSTIYISGYPHPVGQNSNDKTNYEHRLVPGAITGLRPKPEEGYELSYNNITAVGVSGGPILDENAMLVGIHGQAEGSRTINPSTKDVTNSRTGINFGIPLQLFLDLAPRSGIDLNLKIEQPALDQLQVRQAPQPIEPQPVEPQPVEPQAVTTEEDKYNDRGIEQYNLGKYKDAIESYNQAISMKPDFAYAYNNRGNARNLLGDEKGAIEDISHAIELNPSFYEAYTNRGNIRLDLGDKEGAIEDYSKSIELKPDYADNYRGRGNAWRDLGNNDAAMEDYSKAMELYPADSSDQEYVSGEYGKLIPDASEAPQAK